LTYKILHFGDTHLGRKHPSDIRKRRVESSIKAFQHCIQKAVEEDVDLVIHAGDVFDTVYPWHTVIEAAEKRLEKLEENGIPMYCIRGNHDRSFGQDRNMKGLAIEHLTSEYVQLIDPQASNFPEDGYIDFDEDLRIYGLGYHASRTPEVLREFEPREEGINLLLLHDFVEGVTRSYSENLAKADMLAGKNLDYVAIGHDHQPNQEQRINDTVFAATGGTIDYDFNTTEFDKGYNIVEIGEEGLEVEKRKVPQTLELRKEVFDVKKKPAEIRDIVKDNLEEKKDYAVKVRVSGRAENPGEVPTQRIREELNSLENVLMADTILDVETGSEDRYESGQDRFSLEQYLEMNLEEEEKRKKTKSLHTKTRSMLSNEENLTSSGLRLEKEARQDLRKTIEKEMFGGKEE